MTIIMSIQGAEFVVPEFAYKGAEMFQE